MTRIVVSDSSYHHWLTDAGQVINLLSFQIPAWPVLSSGTKWNMFYSALVNWAIILTESQLEGLCHVLYVFSCITRCSCNFIRQALQWLQVRCSQWLLLSVVTVSLTCSCSDKCEFSYVMLGYLVCFTRRIVEVQGDLLHRSPSAVEFAPTPRLILLHYNFYFASRFHFLSSLFLSRSLK